MGRTWNEKIAGIIEESGKPLTRSEIFTQVIEHLDSNMPPYYFGTYLFNAKREGIITMIKLPPAKVGYYCNPDWLDENGELKPKYKRNPYWDNTNTQIKT